VDYEYTPEYGSKRAKQGDYDLVDVIPVSDPNASTMSQRVVQYQAVIQMAQMAPDIYDLPQLHRSMLEVLGVKHAEKLVPLPDDMKPTDPVSENMAVLRGKPVKAFMYQDHQAHIQVHMAAMQDPMLMQLIGQNPKAQMMMAAMQAHIADHTAFLYRQKVEQQLGFSLPPEEDKLPPQIETAMSSMMAKAAQQVLMQNQAQAAQQQAQQMAQDPVLQMQQQELQIRAQEVAIKDKKVQADAAAKADELALKEQQLQIDAAYKADKLEAEQERDGARMGIDIAKSRAQAQQRRAPSK